MIPGLRTLRRRVRMAGRGAITGLSPQVRELALAVTTRGAHGPTLMPGPPDAPVLVVAPHPDDEVIGPGATVARHCDDGDEVRVLIVTSGGATAGGAGDVTVVREAESRRALTHLGVPGPPVFARLPDGALDRHRDAVADLISRHGAGAATVYVPSLLDPHPDHAAVAGALADSDLPDDVVVFGYEVWSPVPITVLVDVVEVFARKQAALAEYRVALETVDYVRSASGLAAYRSAGGTLGGRGFAEGFLAMPLGEYRGLVG